MHKAAKDKILNNYLNRLVLTEEQYNEQFTKLFDEHDINKRRKIQKIIDFHNQANERQNLENYKKQVIDYTNNKFNSRYMNHELPILLHMVNPDARLIPESDLIFAIKQAFIPNNNVIKNQNLSLVVNINGSHYYSIKLTTDNSGKLHVKIADSLGKPQRIANAIYQSKDLEKLMQNCEMRNATISKQNNGHSCGAHSIYNLDAMDEINFFKALGVEYKKDKNGYQEFEKQLYQVNYFAMRASIIYEGMKMSRGNTLSHDAPIAAFIESIEESLPALKSKKEITPFYFDAILGEFDKSFRGKVDEIFKKTNLDATNMQYDQANNIGGNRIAPD